MHFYLNHIALSAPTHIPIRSGVVAGWTGRDPEAVEKHIRELELLGVKRPVSVPVFYRVSAARLTTGTSIEVLGEASSGEVEFVLLQHARQLWIGVGSDHTDREVERFDVSVSKQMCDKPIANSFWAYADVKPHWNELVLRSWIDEGNERKLYQEGRVTTMLEPAALIARYAAGTATPLADGTLMFGGTLAALGGIRASRRFSFELEDPVLKRKISHAYEVHSMAVNQ